MKRFNNIFDKITEMDNLILAHRNARRDKSYYKEVKMVDSDPEYYLKQIQQMLVDGTYNVSNYKISTINDKGKERIIMKLPYYPDRIIQWALMLQIEQIFLKTFCNHTCASIKGRGIHYATKLTRKYLKDQENTKYCLKLDINKFYPSIDRVRLKELLKRKFKDNRLLGVIYKTIDSCPGDKGIPIGSYLSQYLANFYLSYFDHWLKERNKVKYVVRYMDDIVIFANSKERLRELKDKMALYLNKELGLQIKSNWQIFPTRIRGVDFVGYRHFGDYNLLRKSTAKRFKKKMRNIKKSNKITYSNWCSANAYYGWLKWCDSFRIIDKYYTPISKQLIDYHNNKIKGRHRNEDCKRRSRG